MGLLDRPDSTLLLVIMGACILGLLLLAATTFFPGLSGRFRSDGPADAYPIEPVEFADRLSRAGYETYDAKAGPEQESVTVIEAPKPEPKRAPARKTTASTAKKQTARKPATKAAPRSRSKSSPKD